MPDTERKQESESEIPAVRSFQFDHDSIGAIKNSVNLFRGEVNLSVPLLTLPGRGGLDVAVSAVYASNVQSQVKRWNREMPTSVLGLGFDVPYERIEVNPRGSASLEDNLYSLVSGGGRTRLLRSDQPWKLLDLTDDVAASLCEGDVTAQLRAELASHGIALSDRCALQASKQGGWILEDAACERTFRIVSREGGLMVEDGGQGFETEAYQFTQIRYYPSYERWLLVDEGGKCKGYGGGAAGNGIQWGVRWGNWYGTSTVTEGQERYPVAWNLTSLFDRWGDRVVYTYDVVEQQVGMGGLAYTKACYPETITDTYGRSVLFRYDDKSYVVDPPSGPREFADPHKPVPDDQPSAFQDRYEAKFLARVVVRDRAGQETYSVVFGYSFANVTGLDPADPEQAGLYGDTTKRLLRSVTRVNHTGESLPGMSFDYYLESDAEHPGALRSVTYPEGGVATYTYEEQDLPICQRDLPIARPAEGPREYWVPRVWFGPDYAVVAWFNTDSAKLRLTVYTWLGFWYAWSTAEMSFKVDLDPNSMAVEAEADFFAFHYQGRSAEWTEALLFHERDDALGRWTQHADKLRLPSMSVDFESGDGFLLALSAPLDTLRRYTWSWRERAFVEESFRLGETFCSTAASADRKYYLGANNRYYLVLCYDNRTGPGRSNCLKLFHLDALGAWHEGGSAHPDEIVVAQLEDRETFFWAPGETFAAATYVTASYGSVFDYRVQIFHWDADYAFVPEDEFTKDLRGDWRVPFVGGMIADSLVGSGPHLLRYNGLEWQHKDLGRTMAASSDNVFWFAYGQGMALMTQNGVGQILCTLGVYDPETDSTAWRSEPALIENLENPPAYQKTRYYPTAAVDYATLDRDLYFRGSLNDWASIREKKPIYQVPGAQTVDTTTMIDQGPSFVAYLEVVGVSGDLRPARTRVLCLENGRVAAEEVIDAQIYEIYDANGRHKANLSGKSPAGPESLVTFPLGEQDLDRASEITLRRHVHSAMRGVIKAYPVMGVTIDSGLSPTRTTLTRYAYDFDTAVCDPTGQVVKYFKAAQYAGEEGSDGKPHGSTESIYINGLPTDQDSLARARRALRLQDPGADEGYSALDGYLERQNVYSADGSLVGYSESVWEVKTTVVDGSGNVIPIRGTYVLNTAGAQMTGGVTTTTTYEYDLSSGQRTGSSTWIYGSQGTRTLHTDHTTYGYEVYPQLRATNLLNAGVQTIQWVQPEGAEAAVAMKSSATRYKPWPRHTVDGTAIEVYDAYDSYGWRGGPASPVFTAWDADTDPSVDWLRGSAAIVRSEHGLVIESIDAMGLTSSVLYDVNGEYTVASFGNASLLGGEADYVGFEDYEVDTGWRMQPSGGSWSPYALNDQGHTGRRCLRLSGPTTGDQRLQRIFEPRAQQGRFLFSVWYKTPSGFAPDPARAGVEISVLRADVVVATIVAAFEDTQGEWRYLSRAVDLAAFTGGPLRLRVAAGNSTSAEVRIDDLRLSAFVGTFSATVYDPRFDLTLATLGPNLETGRVAYDEFQRSVATSGPIENVPGLSMTYLSTQANGAFAEATPNASIAVQGTGAGFFADFFRDGGYEDHFSTLDPSLWRIVDGALVYEGSAESTISLSNPSITARWSARVTATPRSTPTRPLGLRVGDRLTVSWDPGAGSWTLTDRGRALRSNAAARVLMAPPRDWLLAIVGQTVLFFADGQPIFSELLDTEVSGTFGLFAGDPVAFSSIAVCESVEVAQSFTDGAGNPRQSQTLDGDASVVSETVYDSEGRGAVVTKPARLGPSVAEPLLAYRLGFVDSIDWVSGVLDGEVSRYYGAGGAGPTDDQGYPYSRERYEDSPLGRVVEQGKPGKSFAIVDLASTTPADRHTSKIAYGANVEGGFMSWLPPGRYNQTTVTGPDGDQSYRIEDAGGTRCGEGSLVDVALHRYNTTAFETACSSAGVSVRTRLPNAFDPPAGSAPGDWEVSTLTDALGLTLRVDVPDVGLTEYVFDPAGRRRFEQPAQGRKEGYYLYHRYDALGRVLEDGYLVGAFDRTELQRIADQDPSWPAAALTWARRTEYDGDGSDPCAMSRVISVTVGAGDGEAESRERYRYDPAGNLRERVQELPAGGASYVIACDYDGLGKPTRVRYVAVEGAEAAPEVTYRYDALGRMSAVGDGDDPEAYARYSYNADGSLASELLAQGTSAETARTCGYNPPGWLTSIADGYFSQRSYYDRYGDGQTGYYDGRVAEDTYSLRQVPAGGLGEYGYRYRYDALARLVEAATSVPGGGLKIDTYDQNGNLGAISRGSDAVTFRYRPGTDEVVNTTGGSGDEYAYDDGGSATRLDPRGLREIVYDRTTRLVRSLNTPSGEVRFQYDGSGRRILEDRGNERRISLHAGINRPLIERIERPDGDPTSIVYIYGRAGLLGFLAGGRFWLVLPDRLGSSRVLVGDDGVAAAVYAYRPFGELLSEAGSGTGLLNYLFIGQKLDRDLGLYDLNARFYDPSIGRFIGADPQQEYASPYVYSGNQPMLLLDPSGQSDAGKAFGIFVLGAVGVATALAGAALTVFTAGAASPLVVGALGAEGAVATAITGAIVIGGGAVGSAMIGGGVASATYSFEHMADPDSFSGADWAIQTFSAVGIGFGTGLISGGTSFGLYTATQAGLARGALQVGGNMWKARLGGMVVQGLVDAGMGAVDQVSSNAISGAPLGDGVTQAILTGAMTGALSAYWTMKLAKENYLRVAAAAGAPDIPVPPPIAPVMPPPDPLPPAVEPAPAPLIPRRGLLAHLDTSSSSMH